MGRDKFPWFLQGLIRLHSEMARVREYWSVLECSHGSTRFSPLAARRASGLAEYRTAFSARPHLPYTQTGQGRICAPSRSLGCANQICILPWPDSRALFTMQTESNSRGEDYTSLHCTARMEPLAPWLNCWANQNGLTIDEIRQG